MTDLVVVEEIQVLTELADDQVVVEELEVIEILTDAAQGPEGKRGPPGPVGDAGGALLVANRLSEFDDETKKSAARANLGLQVIDGGTFF